MQKLKAHDSTARNREGQSVTDPPTQRSMKPCKPNPATYAFEKKNSQTPKIYKSSSISLMRGPKLGECSRRFLALTWRRCRQQRQQRRQQGRSSSASSVGSGGSRGYSTGGAGGGGSRSCSAGGACASGSKSCSVGGADSSRPGPMILRQSTQAMVEP